jgi:hypothetical protein
MPGGVFSANGHTRMQYEDMVELAALNDEAGRKLRETVRVGGVWVPQCGTPPFHTHTCQPSLYTRHVLVLRTPPLPPISAIRAGQCIARGSRTDGGAAPNASVLRLQMRIWRASRRPCAI